MTGTSTYYACTIAQTAPAYLPGTTVPRGSLRPNRYPFLCQSDGSKYSVGQRANHWWAWAGYGAVGVWIPAVFLAGGPDDAPEPGLPVCDSAPTTTPTTTTSPAAPSTDGEPTTTTTSPEMSTGDLPPTANPVKNHRASPGPGDIDNRRRRLTGRTRAFGEGRAVTAPLPGATVRRMFLGKQAWSGVNG